MRVEELLEGRFRGHGYELGYHPTSRDRGLERLYNSIIPHLSKVFKIPVANFKVQSDHGFGWQTGRHAARPYSAERCLMQVVLRKKGLDVELISKLLPKVLKSELSKTFEDVHVEVLQVLQVKPERTVGGFFDKETRTPPIIELRFSTKYPADWLKWDKERYNIQW